jgi:uncharacterized protein YjiS (DUF1127 family)
MKQLLERLSLKMRRWSRYLQVREELRSYTDRELLDMGMTRADIGEVAREAAALSELSDRAMRQRRFLEKQLGRPYPYPYM